MARPIWNGTISFGLLNVPVQLYSGERSVDLHFRLLDSRDRTPIRYERINAESGEEVAWKDIVKAFEYEKGNYVVVPEEELRAAAPEATESRRDRGIRRPRGDQPGLLRETVLPDPPAQGRKGLRAATRDASSAPSASASARS